jgi:transcriptional regulator GlxA family with amidase domain
MKLSKFHARKLCREALLGRFAVQRLTWTRNGGHVRFGIFIYEGVEPIDLATFGVLSMARRIRSDIEICTIAPQPGVTLLANGLRVLADYDIGSAPELDVLIVTGGPGWLAQCRCPETLALIRHYAATIPIVSVCTGGMILAASGILNGKAATTKREVAPPEMSPLQRLRDEFPSITVHEASLVDEDRVVTGGGVSLCIDTMLHLLKRLFGAEMAAETARIIEYQRAWAANLEQFPIVVMVRQ